jgi:hypothetical protein
VFNDDQADTYIKDLRRAEINADRLDQMRNILDQVRKEAMNRTSREVYTAISHTIHHI